MCRFLFRSYFLVFRVVFCDNLFLFSFFVLRFCGFWGFLLLFHHFLPSLTPYEVLEQQSSIPPLLITCVPFALSVISISSDTTPTKSLPPNYLQPQDNHFHLRIPNNLCHLYNSNSLQLSSN